VLDNCNRTGIVNVRLSRRANSAIEPQVAELIQRSALIWRTGWPN